MYESCALCGREIDLETMSSFGYEEYVDPSIGLTQQFFCIFCAQHLMKKYSSTRIVVVNQEIDAEETEMPVI